MVSMSDELKERNILKLILVVRFACATLDVEHPIPSTRIKILSKISRYGFNFIGNDYRNKFGF
jgi:hypothetical protein